MKIPPKHRVFLALPLSEAILQGIERFRQLNDTDLDRPGCRWIALRNLHITLFFLGDVRLEDTTRLCADLRAALGAHAPFQLYFEDFSIQPPANPRMIWARFHGHERFTTLNREAARVCRPYLASVPRRQKKPIPHVTVARLKRSAMALALKGGVELAPLAVRRVELWQSTLQAKGAVYTSLAVFKLGSSPV